jgi:hypothetical protein
MNAIRFYNEKTNRWEINSIQEIFLMLADLLPAQRMDCIVNGLTVGDRN